MKDRRERATHVQYYSTGTPICVKLSSPGKQTYDKTGHEEPAMPWASSINFQVKTPRMQVQTQVGTTAHGPRAMYVPAMGLSLHMGCSG